MGPDFVVLFAFCFGCRSACRHLLIGAGNAGYLATSHEGEKRKEGEEEKRKEAWKGRKPGVNGEETGRKREGNGEETGRKR